METPAVEGLRAQAELLASLSISHLSPSTRVKLADDELSVNAYPTDCGGVIYVGAPSYRIPAEADLAAIFEIAEQVGIAWLKFDSEASYDRRASRIRHVGARRMSRRPAQARRSPF